MKRHVYAPQRTVTVEDGTGKVEDLDGNLLGDVEQVGRSWAYYLRNEAWAVGPYATRDAAVFALVADPSCPAGGPNLYDREGTR